MEHLSEKISDARKRKGWTQQQLSERLNLALGTLLAIEDGQTPANNDLFALARELDDDFGVDWIREHFPINERIRQARKRKGLTLAQLGERINLTHSALSAIENGKTNPARKNWLLLARELDDDFGVNWIRERLVLNEKKISEPKKAHQKIADIIVLRLNASRKNISQSRRAELLMMAKMLDDIIEKELEDNQINE